MAFARRPEVLQSPTTDHALDQSAIRALAPGGGGTAIGAAITTAVQILSGLRSAQEHRPPGAIVLLSDGGSNVGDSPVAAARAARAAHIPIETIALGTSHGTITERRHGQVVTGHVPVSTRELAAIAAASGRAGLHPPPTPPTRPRSTPIWAATLGRRRVTHELDVVFAGGALALLVLAGGLVAGLVSPPHLTIHGGHMTDLDDPERRRAQARDALAQVLEEIKRVIVGQDAMLERVLVSLLAGGHVLLEGVPGLAKTLTVKTLSESAERFVRAHPVHTGSRPGRSHRHPRVATGHRAL